MERILAAGGTIVGKLNMDDFGASGLGETSAFGAPRNPVDPTRSAGGSSGGSGAAVRSGEVDLSLGVDQGGSGRIPAAFCGVVAVKPTHGLVPSWGIIHIDHTIDFVTPIARTVEGAALLLEVIAGHDWRDAQWVRGEPESGDFTGARTAGVEGLRIAVITESAPSTSASRPCSPTCRGPPMRSETPAPRSERSRFHSGPTASRSSSPISVTSSARFSAARARDRAPRGL